MRNALLCMDGWAGRYEQPVIVVGETPTRYRITAVTVVRLAGRNRVLRPGQQVLVPKGAIKFQQERA